MPLGSGYNPHDSDSEDDDYMPNNNDAESSGSESSDTAEDKLAARSTNEAAKNPADSRRHRQALWNEFQQSFTSDYKRQRSRSRPRMVKIVRKYRFAGEYTEEVVEVPENSEDAQRWPHWIDTSVVQEDTSSGAHPPSQPIETSAGSEGYAVQTPVEVSSSTLVPAPPPAQPLPKGRPGPRKPKTTLAALPGSTKPKKLSTLDKSALDWKTHLQDQARSGSSLQDELEANRRGGGYLEKVEFLRRVEDRKEETLESLKGNKRRKI